MTAGWFLVAMCVCACGGSRAIVPFLVIACLAHELDLLGRKRAN